MIEWMNECVFKYYPLSITALIAYNLFLDVFL